MHINITGIDGCGKTTQVDLLCRHFQMNSQRVIKSKAFDHKEKATFSPLLPELDQVAIMFLFQALHVQQRVFVEKMLSQGYIVVTDRWDDSYLAYHEVFGFLSTDPVLRERLNSVAFKNLNPDITFFLDITVQEAMRRTEQRGRSFFDKKSTAYFEKIRRSFLTIADRNSWIILDSMEPVTSVHEKIVSNVVKVLHRRGS